jgi:hypothetical protein
MTTHMTGLSGNIRPPQKAPGTAKPKPKVYTYPCDCFVNWTVDNHGKCSMCGGVRKVTK